MKDDLEFFAKLPVLSFSGAFLFFKVLGISARRDLQCIGHFADGIFLFHRFHHLKALPGTSTDTYAQGFFLKCLSADADSRFPASSA
jgi:hypothetical protein